VDTDRKPTIFFFAELGFFGERWMMVVKKLPTQQGCGTHWLTGKRGNVEGGIPSEFRSGILWMETDIWETLGETPQLQFSDLEKRKNPWIFLNPRPIRNYRSVLRKCFFEKQYNFVFFFLKSLFRTIQLAHDFLVEKPSKIFEPVVFELSFYLYIH
jgi:hypothetical protein